MLLCQKAEKKHIWQAGMKPIEMSDLHLCEIFINVFSTAANLIGHSDENDIRSNNFFEHNRKAQVFMGASEKVCKTDQKPSVSFYFVCKRQV